MKEKTSPDKIQTELGTHKIGDLMKKCHISNPGVKPESLNFYVKNNRLELEKIHEAWRYGAKIEKNNEDEIVSFLNSAYKEVERQVNRT